MLLSEVDRYFREQLKPERLAGIDISMNGIQLAAGGDPERAEIGKAAFAVDACLGSIERAADQGADLLVVHHGLFWGKPIALSGTHYTRIKCMIDNGISLYASHLPLDMHPEFGNNAGICASLGISNPEPFGEYRGVRIGFRGELDSPKSIDQVLDLLGLDRERALSVLPFGPAGIRTVAVVSGGAPDEVYEAIDEKADLYITGNAAHEIYHTCLENGINLISGGHYHTETWGVRLLSEKTADDLGIETVFIDLPTGL